MSLHPQLAARSHGSCELCGAADALQAYTVPPREAGHPDDAVALCSHCYNAVLRQDLSDTTHWRCLTGSIWSEVPAVQALSYKLLKKLSGEDWAAETLESVFPDEAVLAWAEAEDRVLAAQLVHKDAYGVVLTGGDTVVLTQNLNVKGTSFTAPKGTIVRKIRLVADNDEQIEGKINGDTIVILTKYVRKQA